MNGTIKQPNRINYISFLRFLCVMIVVSFHCYGMMYADAHFPSTVAKYRELYYHANQCYLINIAMPMFVFLSGYLFQYLLQLGKYHNFGNLIKKKGLRILLPYLVFGLFFMGTTRNWHPLQLLTSGYWHLWFLPMLFWCFIIGYGIYKFKPSKKLDVILLLITYSLAILPDNILPAYMMVGSVPHWFYWFFIGMLSWKYNGIISVAMCRYKMYIPLMLIHIYVTATFPISYAGQTWYTVWSVSGCVLSLCHIVSKLEMPDCVRNKVELLSNQSFGIYILHYWVALMLVSNTMKRLFGLQELAADHSILFPLIFCLLTFVISWCMSWLMCRTSVGRYLVG